MEQRLRSCHQNFKKRAAVIRVIAHPKMEDMKHLRQIKAPLMEVQINGGSVEEKLNGLKHI